MVLSVWQVAIVNKGTWQSIPNGLPPHKSFANPPPRAILPAPFLPMDILIGLLTVLESIVCILLILIVLMQRPRQEGLGAAFGSGMMDSLAGAQTTNVLQKATTWLGIALFVLTFLLAIAVAKTTAPTAPSLVGDAPAAPATPVPAPAAPTLPTLPAGGIKPVDLPATTATQPVDAKSAKSTPAAPADAKSKESAPATPAPAPAPSESKPKADEAKAAPAPAPAPAAPATPPASVIPVPTVPPTPPPVPAPTPEKPPGS
jgi:preprotein translocase subunit SecG